ncbi:MAG: hypothetical protein LBC90_06245, partial [Candidatus Adiutrix sp.]|nr:hypothetical protein [Candidatus Adiutrix sp.]
ISSPRITAASGQTVSIKQGRLWGEETSTTVANIELQQVVEKVLKEVVMELKVTPHFEKNNQFIILGIDLRNDAAGAALSGGDHSSDIRRARTMIKDGDTVVIGGLMTDNQTPGSIRRPLLGWLLPDSKAANSEYELLIFITPNIIPISS